MTNVEFLAVILYTGLFMMLLQLMFMFAYFGPPRFMFNDDDRTCDWIAETCNVQKVQEEQEGQEEQETQDENKNEPEPFDTLEGVNYNEQNANVPVPLPVTRSLWSIW